MIDLKVFLLCGMFVFTNMGIISVYIYRTPLRAFIIANATMLVALALSYFIKF